MNALGRRRTLVHLRDEAGTTLLRVDVLLDGRVRLHGPAGTPDLCAETIEDLVLFAAASDLDGEWYGALLWELELLASRGDGDWSPR